MCSPMVRGLLKRSTEMETNSLHAIQIDGAFSLIPVFRFGSVVRLSAQGFFETCTVVLCEVFDKHLKGQPLGRGQALCTAEDNFDFIKGTRISLGRALDGMVKSGIMNEEEAKRTKSVLEKAISTVRK